MKNQYLKEKRDEVKGSISGKVLRATQKGASSWLTVLPIIEMNFDLNKNEFRDAVKFRYHWVVPDTRSVCVCGDIFGVDYAMICKRSSLSSNAIMNRGVWSWKAFRRLFIFFFFSNFLSKNAFNLENSFF